MSMITLKQEMGDHLFKVIQNGEVIDHCDLLAAEEIAASLEERKFAVKWVYPEDIRIERKTNA